VIWASSALAQQQDPREVQARKDCLTGKVESGVALLAELFAETGNSNFVYNQARCYEQNTRPEQAISRFREYLRVAKDITAAEKADVEKHIEECRALKAEQERERKAEAAAAIPPAPAGATVQPAAAPGLSPETAGSVPEATPAALDLTTKPTTTGSTPIYAKWWFWTGLAVVVGGAVTAYLLATHRTTENACAGARIPCDAVK